MNCLDGMRIRLPSGTTAQSRRLALVGMLHTAKDTARRVKMAMIVMGLLFGLAPAAARQDDIAARRKQIDSLGPSEMRELNEKKNHFDRLSQAEQDRLRKLDAQIRQHPRSEELLQVLGRYGQWLASLESKDRAELQALPPNDRLARIQQMRQSEQRSRLSKCGLTERDADTVFQWWAQSAEQNESLMLTALSDKEREMYDGLSADDPRRTRMLGGVIWRSLGQLLDRLPRDDTNRLIDQLSNDARRRFLELETPEAENRQLEKWIREAFLFRLRPPSPSDDELLRTIEDLPAEEQKRLEKMPRDELLQALRERWESQQMWRRMRSRRGMDRDLEGRRRPEDRRRPDDRFRGEGGRPDFRGPPPGPPGEFPGRPPRFDGGRRPNDRPPRDRQGPEPGPPVANPPDAPSEPTADATTDSTGY